jgi:hypothetical protein
VDKQVCSTQFHRAVALELDRHNLAEAILIAEDALQKLHRRVEDQLRGTASLYELCRVRENGEDVYEEQTGS